MSGRQRPFGPSQKPDPSLIYLITEFADCGLFMVEHSNRCPRSDPIVVDYADTDRTADEAIRLARLVPYTRRDLACRSLANL